MPRFKPNTNFETPPTLTEGGAWYCVTTNHPPRAALELYALGYRTFFPKVRRWVSHARTRTAKEKPLLGRYLFVHVDQPAQSLGAVRSANGIQGFVCTLGSPAPFPSECVEDLRMRYMAGEWDEVAKGPLPVGARIRVVEGEFENLLATITKRKGSRVTFKLKDSAHYGVMHECSLRAA